MSDEDFARAVEDTAAPPRDTGGGRDVIARAKKAARAQVPRAAEVPRRKRMAARVTLAVAAAALAAGVAGLVVERRAIVAWVEGPARHVQPLPAGEPPIVPPAPSAAGPTPEERMVEQAADHRREADAFCAARRWAACLVELNQARWRDPGGDDTPEIREMRALIAKEGPKDPCWNGKCVPR
jgi:hypothetical protein